MSSYHTSHRLTDDIAELVGLICHEFSPGSLSGPHWLWAGITNYRYKRTETAAVGQLIGPSGCGKEVRKLWRNTQEKGIDNTTNLVNILWDLPKLVALLVP